MTPLDFIKLMADNHYNTPAGILSDALTKQIKIHSASKKWRILSYYFDDKSQCMVIDIEEKE
jgi:hypothetical protein